MSFYYAVDFKKILMFDNWIGNWLTTFKKSIALESPMNELSSYINLLNNKLINVLVM